MVIDIGNSQIKTAVFDDNDLISHHISSSMQLPPDALSNAEHVIVSCVRDRVPIDVLTQLEHIPFHIVSAQSRLPFTGKEQLIRQTGTDRLANAAFGSSEYPQGSSLVIDLGTCVTYTIVSQGEFLGGAISPGFHSRLVCMKDYTGKLPAVVPIIPETFPATNTQQAMLNGAWRGVYAEITHFISLCMSKFGEDLRVWLTGGDHVFFEDALKNIIFADAFLTLKGLNVLSQINAQE